MPKYFRAFFPVCIFIECVGDGVFFFMFGTPLCATSLTVYDTGLRWYYVRPEEHFIRVVESIDQYVPAAGTLSVPALCPMPRLKKARSNVWIPSTKATQIDFA